MNTLFSYAFIHWNVAPNIFPSIDFLRWYGVCWALGIALGIQVLQRLYQQDGVDKDEVDYLSLYMIIGIMVGARLGHILFYDPLYYWQHPIEILPIRLEPEFSFVGLRGLASHGGAIGAFIALWYYHYRYKKAYLWLLDRLVIAAALLGGFIRFGNLLNSEVIGKASNLPWAFIFEHIDSVPRHPTPLYEALCYFGIFFILLLLRSKFKTTFRDGFVFSIGLSLIFICRFLIEFLKLNQGVFEESATLNMGQFLSLPMIAVGIAVFIFTTRRKTIKA